MSAPPSASPLAATGAEMRSFRTRLFVTALAIVVAVIAAVLALGGSRLLDHERQRLEARMCLEARRLATQPLRHDDPERLAEDIAVKLHLPSSSRLRWRIEHEDGSGAIEAATPAFAWPSAQAEWTALAPTEAVPAPEPPDGPGPRPARGKRRALQSCAAASIDDGAWRVVRFDGPQADGLIAVDLAALRGEIGGAMRDLASWVLPLALGLAGLAAWLLSSLMMRPVNRLREAMAAVNPQALDQRLAAEGEPREFQELIHAYNTMLERLEASFRQASRFSADAAHELKTPLTILRGRIEQAVNQSDHRAIQADLTVMLDEVGSLAAITRKLLLLSQADAGSLALNRTTVDISAQLQALAADARMIASDRRLQLRIDPDLTLAADELLLRQLFNNLISNAIRHGRPDGWIELAARHVAGAVEVEVANDCAPLDGPARERLFDRFYRGQATLGRATEGHGLGLSLAREIARAHGGDLGLEPTPDTELRLRLRLPDLPAAAARGP